MAFEGLAVIVVGYGSSGLLAENLAPLTRRLEGARTFVVDNRTSDAERAAMRRLSAAEGWDLLEPAENLGFGLGMNAAAERAIAAGAAHLLLLNPDATIEPADVSALLAAAGDDPLVLLAPRVLRPDGSVWFDGSDLHLGDGRITATRNRERLGVHDAEQWLSGACLLVSADLWTRIGGFGDGYFLYWEDADLCRRLRAKGYHVRYVPGASAIHRVGQSSRTTRRSAIRAFHRSAYLYYATHVAPAPLSPKRALARAILGTRCWMQLLAAAWR